MAFKKFRSRHVTDLDQKVGLPFWLVWRYELYYFNVVCNNQCSINVCELIIPVTSIMPALWTLTGTGLDWDVNVEICQPGLKELGGLDYTSVTVMSCAAHQNVKSNTSTIHDRKQLWQTIQRSIHLRTKVTKYKYDLYTCGGPHEASFQRDKHTCIHHDFSADTPMHRTHDHTRLQLHNSHDIHQLMS